MFITFSCERGKYDNEQEQISDSILAVNAKVQDSISRMNAGAYLATVITQEEIDSILKNCQNSESKSGQSITFEGSEYTDWSGLIHLKVWYNSSSGHTNNLSVEVGEDYVLVGGGAKISYYGYGAYLTRSMPDADLRAWQAASKDHVESCIHTLYTFAIGMRIDGVSRDYLRSKMNRFASNSGKVNHPSGSVTIPLNYIMIGGGAWINWEDDMGWGNLLVASYPYGNNTWRAEGKDHLKADPSIINVYAIGIENIAFPNVGYIQVNNLSSSLYTSSGSLMVPVSVPTGWVMTCCGGKATYNYSSGWGRMIVSNYPSEVTNNLSTVETKDHIYACGTYYYDYVYALRVQKAQ